MRYSLAKKLQEEFDQKKEKSAETISNNENEETKSENHSVNQDFVLDNGHGKEENKNNEFNGEQLDSVLFIEIDI